MQSHITAELSFYILPVLLFNEICFPKISDLEVLNLFLLMKNLIKQGFKHLFVPTSNVYLHSEKGSGFYWSQPFRFKDLTEVHYKDKSFNENQMISWGYPCLRKFS